MKLEPQSHFFTIPNLITQSSSTQSFGSIYNNEANQFRITNKFTALSGAKAFAICTGVVLVQPQTASSTKVNLIIKPFKQPIQGLSIKYFVYRGLEKSDFFTNDNKVVSSSGNTSDFVNKINADFADFNANENPPPDFDATFIGFNPSLADSTPLDNLFYKITEYVDDNGVPVEVGDTAYELPLIEIGKSLGNFSVGECGIDVVLNYGDYNTNEPLEFVFDLGYARASEAVIDVTSITDAFEKKIIREQITQFLDIAAYYGAHHCENGVVYIDNTGVKVKKTFDAIYNDVLSAFTTKNRLYLYIQSDRTRSYNFYGNYTIEENSSNSLKLGYTETTITGREFSTNSWPVIIDEGIQTHNETRNDLFIQFVTDNNIGVMLYGQVATIENAQKNNFSNADDLLLPPDTQGVQSTLTKIIQLSNPAIDNSGQKYNIANFNILIYQGVKCTYLADEYEDQNQQTISIYQQANFFDDVFELVRATPYLKPSEESSFSIINSTKLKLVHHYSDRKQRGVSAVQTVRINDSIETGDSIVPELKRITYISESIDILNEPTDNSGTPTSSMACSSAVSCDTKNNKTYVFPEPYYYEIIYFTEGIESVTGLELKTTDNSSPSIIILGLTEAENIILLNSATPDLKNIRLFLIDELNNGGLFISIENINYQRYKLGFVAENNDGITALFMPSNEILIYSLDGIFHFSSEYSKYMLPTQIEDSINKTISVI